MTPERAQKYLQREVGDPRLRVRWRTDIERFEVGRAIPDLASDRVEWFYIVSDGDSGYRPIDTRTVRKVISLDTWRRPKTLSLSDFLSQLEERKISDQQKEREAMKYRIKHEARYIKKAAEKDGVI